METSAVDSELKRLQHSEEYHTDQDKHWNFIKDTKEPFAVSHLAASECFDDAKTIVVEADQNNDQDDFDPNPYLA
jgi:hypothetical protein